MVFFIPRQTALSNLYRFNLPRKDILDLNSMFADGKRVLRLPSGVFLPLLELDVAHSRLEMQKV